MGLRDQAPGEVVGEVLAGEAHGVRGDVDARDVQAPRDGVAEERVEEQGYAACPGAQVQDAEGPRGLVSLLPVA